ncbi:MAG: 2-carboxy-1,4-naphthoquinone phytyltransferase [Leptolyngbyaceae bacterium]|nr:2-carboxy-1,4-naphthoquinone phytyltransferase [Leptolyngbyaceae bacterium]
MKPSDRTPPTIAQNGAVPNTTPLNVSVAPSRKRLWMAAIKPPMYSVAIMPIWWGSAIAYYEQLDRQSFNWPIFLTFTGAAILILAWENLANDAFDAETGIDENKLHSVVNLTGNRPLVLGLANLFLALGLVGIGAIAFWQNDATVLWLIIACCGLGYLYQGPPFRLGYQGLGEILCFFAFGPLAVSAAYYSQTQTFSLSSIIASIALGLTTTLVLFCSHFHQVEDDVAAGKRSPIVRMGTHRGAQLLPWICGSVYGVIALLILTGLSPLWSGLSIAGIPAAIRLCRHVGQYHDQPNRVMNCKFIAIALHFWSGLLFGLGYILP